MLNATWIYRRAAADATAWASGAGFQWLEHTGSGADAHPQPRLWTAMASLGVDSVIMFGGLLGIAGGMGTPDKVALDDTWIFTVRDNDDEGRWKQWMPGPGQLSPSRRYSARCVGQRCHIMSPGGPDIVSIIRFDPSRVLLFCLMHLFL